MNTNGDKYFDDSVARRYWLGRLDPAELDRFESEVFADDDSTELLSATRDELVDEYLLGELSDIDRKDFVSYFLSSPAHVQMLAISDVYRRATAEEPVPAVLEEKSGQSWFAAFSGLFRQPVLAFTAGALLIAAVGLFVVLRFPETDNIAQVNPPEIERPIAAPNIATSSPSGTTTTAPDPNKAPKRRLRTQIATIVLSGISRDGNSEIASAKVTDETLTVRLAFPVPPILESFENYQAEVTSESGVRISTSKLPNLENVQRDSQLTIDVPATRLKPGTYTLRIVGKREGKTDETLHRGQFRIN